MITKFILKPICFTFLFKICSIVIDDFLNIRNYLMREDEILQTALLRIQD